MAENREDKSREDLTEEASPHRVEEYRRRGIVAQSRELSGLAGLFATGIAAYILSPRYGFQMMQFMKDVFQTNLSSRMDLGSTHLIQDHLFKTVHLLVSIGLPICGAGFLIGALGSFLQIGTIFSLEPLLPDFERLDPIQGLIRLISPKQLIEGLRLIIKMAVVLAIAYLLVKSRVLHSSEYLDQGPGALSISIGKISKDTFLALLGVLALFAGIDYALQRFEYSKNLRMTKQEAKQEYKEREGDPQIRARIRSVQREMARKRMMQAVKKADVIVTNPTHIAVAIVYEKSTMSAPKVVAKGADFMAQKIKQIGASAGVPLVENVALARTLYKSVKVGQYVPRALYQAVAEVLAYVYRLRKKDL